MKSGPGRPFSRTIRFKLSLLVAGPLLVLLGFGVVELLQQRRPAEAVAERGRLLLTDSFDRLLEDARALTAGSFDDSAGGAASSRLRDRLEGALLFDADRSIASWRGTPVEPPTDLDRHTAPAWRVRLDGVRTRLLVHAPLEDGRSAFASFVIDSPVPGMRFEELLAGLGGYELSREFLDTEAFYDGPLATRAGSADESALNLVGRLGDTGVPVLLTAPGGEILAVAAVQPVDPLHRRGRLRAAGRAWATALALLLLAAIFDWRSICSTPLGFLGTTGIVVVGRLVLGLVRFSGTLPRELGSASLYGSAGAWQTLASPADVALTALAIFLICLAARRLCAVTGPTHRWPTAAAATLLAVAVSCAAVALSLSFARDARIPLADRPRLFEADTGTLLLLGLVLIALGAAEVWAIVYTLMRRRPLPSGKVPVAVALLVLAGVSSVALGGMTQRLSLERLRTEYAPLTLDQTSRRELALTEAVRYVHETYRNGAPEQALVLRPEFLAYRFWADGELGHAGYKSSLAFYNPEGAQVSHFGFDLPEPDETIVSEPDAPAEVTLFEERHSVVADFPQEVLHASIPVLSANGTPLGTVVGHILDEPDNLPFLPWSRPYLLALGAGRATDEIDSEYVLYDGFGTVLVTTLRQPPADTPLIREQAGVEKTVRITAGDQDYIGVALPDKDRLHLLMIPARGIVERLAAMVRLGLLGLTLLVLIGLAPRLLRLRSLDLLRQIQRSFYRKLLATLLIASVLPLVGLALLLRGTIEQSGRVELRDAAIQYVGVAQRVLEDYGAAGPADADGLPILTDNVLYWLRRVVGQEINVYDNGMLQATSKRELFHSGLLPLRLDGEVQRRLVLEGLPYLVIRSTIGSSSIPVAYAPVRSNDPHRSLVVAVPVVQAQKQIDRAVGRVLEVILLATVLLVGLLALSAAARARTVARPVRALVRATAKITAGDYDARLEPETRDEVAELVEGFNGMARALGRQRADLERRREYMERLLRHATTSVVSTDADGRIVTFNPAAHELLAASGVRPAIGDSLADALSNSSELAPLAGALEATPRHPAEPLEIDVQRGQEHLRYRCVRIELADPTEARPGALILLDDVTDLMRSNQLAAWAEMARAIAHEIKNPLTPIQLSTEHLRRLLRDRGVLPSEEMDACLDTIIKQVRNLHEIAGDFSAYAKLPALAPVAADPVAFMRSAIGPYRAAAPTGITILESYEPAESVAVDHKVLSRAVVNLIENALQAMPDGGELAVRVHPVNGRPEVALEVRDNGIGIDPEVRRRLFEPYFSTKSSGTGLGLAIVRRAVEAHRGQVEVESLPGRGTTVRILLPTRGA